jgi:hypothetical protein
VTIGSFFSLSSLTIDVNEFAVDISRTQPVSGSIAVTLGTLTLFPGTTVFTSTFTNLQGNYNFTGAAAQGRKVKVGRFPMSANSMATILGERDGFGKIVSDEESMEILGVHLMGPRVTELIQGPALAKLLEATPEELALNVHPHPTVSEVLGEMADDVVFGQSLHFWRQK